MPRFTKDALTTLSLTLPAAASTSVVTATDLDLGSNQGNAGSDFPEELEVLITVPALTTTMLPDTKTLTLQLQNSATTPATTPFLDAIVITGAGGAGATGTGPNGVFYFRRRIQSNALRYLNLQATTGANTTTMAALAVELALVY